MFTSWYKVILTNLFTSTSIAEDQGLNVLLPTSFLLPKSHNQSNCNQSFQTFSESLCSLNLKLAFFLQEIFLRPNLILLKNIWIIGPAVNAPYIDTQFGSNNWV